MKMIQLMASGQYQTLEVPVARLRALAYHPLLPQLSDWTQRLQGNADGKLFLAFSHAEEWAVIQLLKQIDWCEPNQLPEGMDPKHKATGIRPFLDNNLAPHGLMTAVVPLTGGMKRDPLSPNWVLAITSR